MSDRDLSGLSPDDLIVLAARGDAAAQYGLAVALETAVVDGLYDYAVGMRMAEMMMRMACSHGHVPDLWHRQLAALLMHSAGACEMEGRSTCMMELAADSVDILDRLADEGDEESAASLMTCAAMLPEVIKYAALRRRDPCAAGATIH